MLATLLSGIAVGIALMAIHSANRRPQTIINIQAEPVMPGSKGPSLPPFIEQPQIPTERYRYHFHQGGNN